MTLKFCVSFLLFLIVTISCRDIFSIDEKWICNVKRSCKDCLLFSQCSWCPSEGKCFSKQNNFDDVCGNNSSIDHRDHGFSLEDNAKCACATSSMLKDLEQSCYQPNTPDGLKCSGRGICECGRCICNLQPDPAKMVIGDYCEFDNFSCDGPKCNEGPYSISQPENSDDDSPKLESEDVTEE